MARLIGNLLPGIIIFVLIAYFNNLRIDRKNEQQEREQTRKLDDWSDAEKEAFRNQMNKPRG
jgi:preprotein translocase subunit YajC